jgi:hypothetical protein
MRLGMSLLTLGCAVLAVAQANFVLPGPAWQASAAAKAISQHQAGDSSWISFGNLEPGEYIARQEKLNFRVQGARGELVLRAVAKSMSDPSRTYVFQQNFVASEQGVRAQLLLDFPADAPEGEYRLTVQGAETGRLFPAQSYTVRLVLSDGRTKSADESSAAPVSADPTAGPAGLEVSGSRDGSNNAGDAGTNENGQQNGGDTGGGEPATAPVLNAGGSGFPTQPDSRQASGTIRVTSPNPGAFLGLSNQISFDINNAQREVTVVVTATRVANPSEVIRAERDFVPNDDNEVNSSITLNFSDSTPEGEYTLEVTAFEPGKSYNTVSIDVNVDVIEPRFLDTDPLSGAFVRGSGPNDSVQLTGAFEELNMREWRVQVNNRDIPNNSGTGNNFSVDWSVSGIENDGSQTVRITAEDLAENTASKSLNLTLDRVRPNIEILTPTPSSVVRPRSNITVAIEITDQFSNAVDVTGVQAILKAQDGRYLGRVARRSVRSSGNALTWIGRIRFSRSLPDTFIIEVSAVDKAGNVGQTQEVTVRTGQ